MATSYLSPTPGVYKKKKDLRPQDQSAPTQPFQGRGGFGVTPSGQSSDGQGLTWQDALMQAGKKFGPAGAKILADRMFANQPTQVDVQGSDPNAFNQQRTGERMDMSGAMPGMAPGTLGQNYGPGFQAWMGNTSPTDYFQGLTAAGLSPSAANDVMMQMTQDPEMFNALGGGMGVSAMPSSAGDLGVSGAGGSFSGGEVGAAGAGAGGWGSAAGLVGPAVGYLTSLATKGMDPVAAGLINAGAGAAGSIGGAAAAGAAGASAAGAAAGGGLAGAGAGAAAAGTAMLPAAPLVAAFIAVQIAGARDSAEAAREMKIRLKNIQSQFPAEAAQLQGISNIVNNMGNTPESVAAGLKQLNDVQKGFQEGGWESHWKQGGTSVGGGGLGKGITVDLPGVQSAIDKLSPGLSQMNVARLQGQDYLTNAGWDPTRIKSETGMSFDPLDATVMANSIRPTIAGSQSPSDPLGLYKDAGYNPTFRSALNPPFMQGEIDKANVWNPESSSSTFVDRPLTGVDDLAGLKAMGLPSTRADGSPIMLSDVRNATTPGGSQQNLLEGTPYGMTTKSIEDQVNQSVLPGQYEKSLPGFLAPYGGIDPYLSYFGFANPNGPGAAGPNGIGGMGVGGNAGATGDAGRAVGRLAPANVITGARALPRPEADARTEAVFGMRKPVQGPADQSGGQQAPPPTPGTSAAEAPAFASRPGSGFNIQPGGNVGTAGLRVQPAFGTQGPFGQGQSRNSQAGL